MTLPEPTLGDIYQGLGRVEGKIDLIVDVNASHAERLEKLEKNQSKLMGIMGVVSAIFVGSIIWILKGGPLGG